MTTSNLPGEENKNQIVIDFGSKFIKASLYNSTTNTISYLSNTENGLILPTEEVSNIPNSISSSIHDMLKVNDSSEAIRIGKEALANVKKNNLLGIEFFGAIYNRKRSYVGQNHNFFNIDENVTISDFPIMWYITQFYKQYQARTKSGSLTMILPGYTTDLIIDELKAFNNETFEKLDILRDYRIIERIQSNIFDKKKSKNVLYLDFGAFSAKATLVDKDNHVVFYGFSEDCGIEKVAFRKATENQIEQENITHQKVNEKNIYDGHVWKAREKAYGEISNDSFYDNVFEENLNNLILSSKSKGPIDEIILVGGGCQIPFVSKTIEKLLKDIKYSLIENVTNNKINHLTFLVDGNKLPPLTSQNNFAFHSLYLKYDTTYNISEACSNLNDVKFSFLLGKLIHETKNYTNCTWNDRIRIVTDDSCVLSGMPKSIKKLKIEGANLPENEELFENKLIQVSGRFDGNCSEGISLNSYAELCVVDSNKDFVCDKKFSIVQSNSTAVKVEKVKQQVFQNESAMQLIRALFNSMKGMTSKDKDKSDEL